MNCPIATDFTYSEAVYDKSEELDRISGPEGHYLILYDKDEILDAIDKKESEKIKIYLLPVNESVFNG
jgi:hypothetical protein